MADLEAVKERLDYWNDRLDNASDEGEIKSIRFEIECLNAILEGTTEDQQWWYNCDDEDLFRDE